MTTLSPPFRRAVRADAAALAELVDFAGEGLPTYLWARIARPGESVWDVGRQRAERDAGSFSYRNAIVADNGNGPVAALIGYQLPDTPEVIGSDMPAMFVPLQELENQVCNTWYVNVLAAYPTHRNQGYGTRLLTIAESLARESVACGVSIIVSDANVGACRLYERLGYRHIAKRPMIKEDWQNAGTHWLLLVKILTDSPSAAG